MSAPQHELTTGAQLAPAPRQSRSKRQPPVTQCAALLPKTPAGSQMAFSPVQSSAVRHASLTQTLLARTAPPPQLGCAGPSTHLLGAAPMEQSLDLQHCPVG